MPTEELEQALLAAKWGDAEEDHIEVIARMLDLPRAAVARVMFAASALRDIRGPGPGRTDPRDEIPEKVQTGMKAMLRLGMARVLVRGAITTGEDMRVSPRALTKNKGAICSGCPNSIGCVAESWSTPAECYQLGVVVRVVRLPGAPTRVERNKQEIRVRPTRLRGDTVTVVADQPRGEYTVNAEDLWWT